MADEMFPLQRLGDESQAEIGTEVADPPRRRRKSDLLQRVEYALYRIVASAVRQLSPHRIRVWGSRLGAIARLLLRRRHRLALHNLAMAFPGKPANELNAIARECWRHFGREALQSLRMQRMSLQEIAAQCTFVNEDILREAIARGRGVVLISAHYGGWEVGGLALTALVGNVRTVARRLDNEYLERDLARLRERTGAAVINRRKAARALMKGLSENAVIVLLPDQAVLPREGVLVPFLGRLGWTTDAPSKMALRHGSTIVFAFCIPDGTTHRLEFEEPILLEPAEAPDQDPLTLTKRINDVISRRIAARPELWLWMHDRWKGTGEGKTSHGE